MRAIRKLCDAHHQAADYPEEDDGILTYSCSSGSWSLRVPDLSVVGFHYRGRDGPTRKRRRMMRFYRECIRRQLYLNGPGQDRTFRKNPTFTGRVEIADRVLPRREVRHPLSESARDDAEPAQAHARLLGDPRASRRGADGERLPAASRSSRLHSYTYPAEVLARHPDVTRIEIDYRDLIERPRTVVDQIYRHFGYSISPAFEKALDEAQARAGSHRTSHRYSLDEFGLDESKIRTELAPLFDRFEWPSVASDPDAAP